MNRLLALLRRLPHIDLARIFLGLFTLAISSVVLIAAPKPIIPLITLLVWILTLATSTNLGITFQETEASFGNIFVTAAFLALGLDLALLVTIAGVTLGEVLQYVLRRQLGYTFRSARRMVMNVSLNLGLHGLSLLVGGWLYLALGGAIPIVEPDSNWAITFLWNNPLPLMGLYVGYFFVNYSLFMTYMWLEHQPVHAYIRAHWRVFVLLEFVPTWFSFLVAVAALNTPVGAFALLCFALIAAMFVPHNLSLSRARLDQRVRELDSLNAVGQAVANSLELPEVLEAIHGQVARLMDARNFYIALYNEAEQTISFPLAYEQDTPVQYGSRPFGEGLTEYVIRRGEPLLLKNDVPGFVRGLGQTPHDLSVKAWLGVPIVMNERTLGVMAVQSTDQPNAYNESHREILVAIATQTATAIRNSQMYMAVRHQTTHLSILNSILSAINSTLDLEHMLNIIVTSVGQVMGNQKAAIYLVEDSGQTVRLAAAHNLSQDYISQSQHIPLGVNERSVVIATQDTLIVTDARTDSRMQPFRETFAAEGVRAFADVPLRVQSQAIGSLTVYYAEPHHFTVTELTELTTFANQAAIAVSNARLYTRADQDLTRRVKQLASLEEIGHDLGASLDLNRVLRRVLERAIAATGATLGGVGIWKPERAVLQVAMILGHEPDSIRRIMEDPQSAHRGIVGRALRTGQSFFITDVREDPDYLPIAPDIRSELVVLIRREEQMLGVIELESTEAGCFNQDALDFVSQLATQAAIALHNAQLYQQAQSRLNELSVLYTIGQQATSILDLKQLGEELTREMARALHTRFCALNVFEPEIDQMNVIAEYTAGEDGAAAAAPVISGNFRLADYPATYAAFKRHELLACYASDPQIDPRELAFLQQHAFHAYLTAPLYSGRELIGAVEWADARAERHFDENETRLAATLASQVASAVQNARLFEDRTRRFNRISQLYQASLVLTTSVELEEVLRRITTVAREITEADAATLYLYDEAREAFTHAYALGVSGEWGVTTLRAGGMTQRVVKERRGVRVNEAREHPEVNPHTIEAGFRSLMATPLIGQGRSVGVLYVGSYKPHDFDDDDAQVVSALMNQAAVAVINARLFADTAQSRDQLQAALDSARDGIMMFDLATRILMVNPQLETMWSLPRQQLVGHLFSDLLEQPELRISEKMGCAASTLRSLLEAVRAGQAPAWPKNSYLLSDSTPPLYVERDCLPVLDATHRPIGWMVMLHDATEELALQQMRDELTDTIVHDLRSPLSSILGSLYMLEEIVDPDQPDSATHQAVAISIRGARKLLNLINSLLDSSKMRSGHTLVELLPMPLELVLNDALEYLAPLAQENRIRIARQLQPGLPLVLIDEDKISRVFINLIDNALKFTPEGGQVTLIAERWVAENGQPFVRCAVRDTGPGIPLEFRARIFDRFTQIADHVGRRRGSGLGLNFCQLAVEAHGGKIWVADAPDGGSEFSFTLPIAPNGPREK